MELSHVVSRLAPNQANNSYAWQSVLKARSVISLSSRWRIGDGRTMKIWGDNWLPDQFSGKVISPQKSLPNNAKVYTLIDEEAHSWLEDRITTEFLPHEAQSISSLLLSNRCVNDELIWKGTSQGVYSTESAYKLLAKN